MEKSSYTKLTKRGNQPLTINQGKKARQFLKGPMYLKIHLCK